MRKYAIVFKFIICCCTFSAWAEDPVTINLTLPKLDVDPYHRPYVAVWIETVERQPIKTLAVWYEQDTWLKDMRQWWRKVGRVGEEQLDAVTGATNKPGDYTIVWDGLDSNGKAVNAGEYLLNIESVREEGGRSYVRQTITLGKSQQFNLSAEAEVGPVAITVLTK